MPRTTSLTGRSLVAGAAQGALLFADVGLSFWGGVDSYSGEVIDRHHPLSGEYLAGRVLAIPSGRGSCTGSSVLMELISNGHAPAALVLAEPDEILTLGVLVAQTIFQRSLPVLCIGSEAFAALRGKAFARVEGSSLTLFQHLPGDTWQAQGRPLPTAETGASIELTELDRALLDGQHGKAAQVAMQIVLRMAELQGAHRLVDVTQAHIDGCIYTGPASLRFAEQLVQWGQKYGCRPPSIQFPSTSAAGASWASTRPSANRPVLWAMPIWRWAHSSASPARPTFSTARRRPANRSSGLNPTRWSTPTACSAHAP